MWPTSLSLHVVLSSEHRPNVLSASFSAFVLLLFPHSPHNPPPLLDCMFLVLRELNDASNSEMLQRGRHKGLKRGSRSEWGISSSRSEDLSGWPGCVCPALPPSHQAGRRRFWRGAKERSSGRRAEAVAGTRVHGAADEQGGPGHSPLEWAHNPALCRFQCFGGGVGDGPRAQ